MTSLTALYHKLHRTSNPVTAWALKQIIARRLGYLNYSGELVNQTINYGALR